MNYRVESIHFDDNSAISHSMAKNQFNQRNSLNTKAKKGLTESNDLV